MNGKATIKRIKYIEDTDIMTHDKARMVLLKLIEPGSITQKIPFYV